MIHVQKYAGLGIRLRRYSVMLNVLGACCLLTHLVAAQTPNSKSAEVLTGIDVLVKSDFKQLAGRRVGLITNHTGRDRSGRSTVDLLHSEKSVKLVALFSPEHGFAGKLDTSKIADSKDERTGLQVFSLYGEMRRPTAVMLADIDTLVFDIQDVGARFYTYVSTMGEAMRAAAEHKKRFVVLDRPNPIGGVDVAGPMLDLGRESFVAFHPLPVRHGMTVGEMAGLFKRELQLDLDLEVIACEGWQRKDAWDATGLVWVNPSPNLRSLTQAWLYPGIGLLRDDQPVRGPWYRYAVRSDRRALDRRPPSRRRPARPIN